MARKSKAQQKREQQEEVRQWITAVILSALVVIGLLRSGIVGIFLFNLQRYLFGNLFWLIIGSIILLILINLMNRHHGTDEKNPAPFVLIICAVLLLCTYLYTDKTGLPVFMEYIDYITRYFGTEALTLNTGGGIAGALLYALCSTLFGRTGVIIVTVVLFLVAALLLVSLDVYKNAFHTVIEFFRTPDREDTETDEEISEEPEEPKPPKNLWLMLDARKEKKKENKVGIEADPEDDKTEETDLSLLTDEEKPHMTSLFNIKADPDTREIPVVAIPGKTISDEESPFINVDDLVDDVHGGMDEPETEEDTQQLPVAEENEMDEQEPEEPVAEPDAPLAQQAETTVETPGNAGSSGESMKRPKRPYKVPNARAINQMLDPLPPKDANGVNETAAREKGALLISILKNFDIEAQLIDTHIGPSVTQFEIKPDASVKVSRILGLADNIKMALAAKDVRIEAPIPGRNAVGIEIPNQKSTPVKMKELINDVPEKDKKQPLLFFLGKDLLGQTVTCRLDKMPHLLIAGATGSGKSVCMNAIICSLLLRTDPEDVKLLLVDPKKVEFTPYQKVPHLIGPVINDPNKANNALKAVAQIMDERYDMFASAGCRNIQAFNQKVKEQNGRPNPDGSPAPKKMPYIVVIIDELADLMTVAGKEVEQSIQRITQLARAAGIHLIVATQRPSVDVITGVIKANIPSRIAFAVSSGTDSRTILDHVGAERLLGNGDMLYMPIGQSGATRVQGVFVTDEEVRRITDYVSARGTPMYDDKFVLLEGVNDGEGGGGVIGVNEDPLFQEVKNYVIEAQKASTSLLQRRFGIGYNRAARMIDALEENGVIGPAKGSKPRDVYIKPDHPKKKTETGEEISDEDGN